MKSLPDGGTDENYYPRKFKNRKYTCDSANDSTSNDEAHCSPINTQKTKEDNFKIKYKTELCKYFEINGKCKFGDNVRFNLLIIISVLMPMGKKIFALKLLIQLRIEQGNAYNSLKMGFVHMEIDVNLLML